MNTTIAAIKNRIHVLEMRDPVVNHNIINKLKRRLRKLESVKLNKYGCVLKWL